MATIFSNIRRLTDYIMLITFGGQIDIAFPPIATHYAPDATVLLIAGIKLFQASGIRQVERGQYVHLILSGNEYQDLPSARGFFSFIFAANIGLINFSTPESRSRSGRTMAILNL